MRHSWKQFEPRQLWITLFAICTMTSWAHAEPLWQQRLPGHANLLVDSKARGIGDLITVVISEATDVDTQEDREMDKSSGTEGGFAFEGEAGGGLGAQAASALLNLNNNAKRNFAGGTSFRSNQAITDRITVRIVDVSPAGNLMVSGQRHVQIGRDQRMLCISGCIRPIDIGPDNTVNSQYVSDLQVHYRNEGPGHRFSEQGWANRWANRIWPF